MNYNNLLNSDLITDIRIHQNHFAASIDWFELSIDMRNELLYEFMGKTLDYEDQWYYVAVIIPHKNGIPEPQKAFLYLDEFEPDTNEDNYFRRGISLYSEQGTSYVSEHCRDLVPSVSETLHILSWILPSYDAAKDEKT